MHEWFISYNYGKDATEVGKWNGFNVSAPNLLEAVEKAIEDHMVKPEYIVSVTRLN